MATTPLTLQSALSLLSTVASFRTTHLLCPDTPRPTQPLIYEHATSESFAPAQRCFHTVSSTSQIPTLPAELWIEIIEYATWIPGAFSTDSESVVAFANDAHGIYLRRRFNETMRTKLSISIVCRQWHQLVKAALYRYLVVTSGASVLRLASHFASEEGRHQRSGDPLATGPGQYARRLEIVLEGFHTWKERHSKALAAVIQSCPNLYIFSNAFCTSITTAQVLRSPILDALAQAPLKRLELKTNMPLVARLVSDCQDSLAVLWLLPSELHKLSITDNVSRITLPRLHTVVTASNADTLQRTWRMPALRSLVSSRRDITPHLEIWGHTLVHLTVNLNCPLVSALRFCPNLQSLTINFDGVIMVPLAKIESHRSLRRITISDCPDFSRRLSWYENSNAVLHAYLRKSLLSLTSRDIFPALDSIRFLLPLRGGERRGGRLDNEYAIPPGFTHVWGSWLRACETEGIKVEAAQGADAQTANTWQPFQPANLLSM